jgi:AICAR transformylase/IMP cyclohydrolase PurH
MKKAFAHTAAYDSAIASFFTSHTWEEVESTYDAQNPNVI